MIPSQILYSNCFIIQMQASLSSHSQTSKCTICLERAGSASIDGCQHGFCLKCIRRWSNSKNTCPLCREPFLAIRHLNRTYRVRRNHHASKQTETQPRFFRIPRQVSYLPVFLNPIPLYLYYPAITANLFSVNYAFSYNSTQNVPFPSSLDQFF